VDVVINYDVPVYMKKYVHRVGRTARAGREGIAYSIVETQEVRYGDSSKFVFWVMRLMLVLTNV